jgi:hypothetical protein
MIMSRLFTFGCSFTHYHYPTWADILSKEFKYHENWGQGGQGNEFIFNSLNECLVKNNITSDDTVIIMWAIIYRDDIYKDNKWSIGPKYRFDKADDPRGHFIKNVAFINATKIMLESVGCKYYFLSLVPVDIDVLDLNSKSSVVEHDISDIRNHYKECLESIRPSVYETIFNSDWTSRKFAPKNYSNPKNLRIDFHSSTAEHLEYLDAVLPEITISNSTRDWVEQVQEHLVQDPKGKNPFELSTYRPWVKTFLKDDPPLWVWKEVNRL